MLPRIPLRVFPQPHYLIFTPRHNLRLLERIILGTNAMQLFSDRLGRLTLSL